MRAERWLLAALACSGFAGLVYEIAWTRLLTLHLGHTTAAVSTVTAAFMSGLGLGGAVGARIAPRLNAPQALRTYARLELVVALSALSIAGILTLLVPVFAWAYGEAGGGSVFAVVRIASAFAALLVPSVALGATFPIAVRVAVASPTRPGGPAGRLYGANTGGAAVGSLAAGFVLIPGLGLRGTVLTGVVASAASIALALSIARGNFTAAVSVDVAAKSRVKGRKIPAADDWDAERSRYGLAAAVLSLTGFATFVQEVVWTRVLAMVIGPSIFAFAATLTSFVTGLALGSFAGAFVAERTRRPALALALTLTATAAASCVALAVVGTPSVALGPGDPAGMASLAGVPLPLLAIACGLTFPIALGLGVAFPLSLELAGSATAIPAQRLGILYAVNTTGAVIGALVAGFVAIPIAGLRASLLIAAAALLLGAVVLTLRGQPVREGRQKAAFTVPKAAPKAALTIAALVPVAAVGAWMATSSGWDREWLAAGGYLYSRFVPPGVDRRAALTAGTLLYYREGATGTVSVKTLTGERSLSIDGKVDASTGRDMLTQKLLAHVPLLLHPNPRQVAIVGLGSGVTLASALVHPIASVDVVEISPEVVEASTHFAAVNRRGLDDPRTRLVRGDGRTHLSLTSRRYDVVISEPSNPWMAGVAALFTKDFFHAVRRRLAPGGVFCQWAHTYDISDADLRSIVATFHSVFPDGTMWLAGDGDLLLVGSDAPLESRLDAMSTTWHRPGVREDLEGVAVREPMALLSLFVGGPAEMARYASGAAVQSDDRMALEFSAPSAVFANVSANHAGTLRALLDKGRRPPAIERALTAARAEQWRDRAAMMIAAEAFDSAYLDYTKALDLGASDTSTLDGFVRAAGVARREDDAERRLRTMIRWRGIEPAPRVALAQLLGTRGRFDEAVAIATEATKLAPADASAWEQLASLHADRGDAVSLERVAEVLRRDFPQRAASWYFAASASFLKGDENGTLSLVRRAIELNPGYADAYNLLGAIRGTAGDLGAAREAFRTSLRLDPRDVVTYINLAQLELAAGQREAAAGWFAEALSLDPNSGPAREGLATAAR